VYANPQKAWLITASLLLLCIYIQYTRKDKDFIYKQLQHPQVQIFFEYAVLTMPFSISSLFTNNWFCYPMLLLALAGTAYLKFQHQHRVVFKQLSSYIQPAHFEWISGFRKQYIALISFYSIALAFSWVRILPLFLLWCTTIMICSFYQENEPVHILRQGNNTASLFLINKIKYPLKKLLLLYTVPIIIQAVFENEFLPLTLLFVPAQLALVCFSIVLKYTTYKPNTLAIGNQVAFSIVSLLAAMPYFMPIPVILSLVYFYKAEKNLKKYLHD
jgi:hypothetical protein